MKKVPLWQLVVQSYEEFFGIILEQKSSQPRANLCMLMVFSQYGPCSLVSFHKLYFSINTQRHFQWGILKILRRNGTNWDSWHSDHPMKQNINNTTYVKPQGIVIRPRRVVQVGCSSRGNVLWGLEGSMETAQSL